MLRNGLSHVRDGVPGFLLNEVLSLNAQECPRLMMRLVCVAILNEVLSLNAQEYRHLGTHADADRSSMKS